MKTVFAGPRSEPSAGVAASTMLLNRRGAFSAAHVVAWLDRNAEDAVGCPHVVMGPPWVNEGSAAWSPAVSERRLSPGSESIGELGRRQRETLAMVGTTQTHEDLAVWRRLLRTGCIAAAVALPLFLFVVMSGVGGYRGGWLWAPVIAAPPLAAVGWGGWGRARGRHAVTAVFALSGVAFGGWASQEADFSHPRLRAAMESITVPASFERTGDSAGGNSVCFDECPSLTRYWVMTGDVDDAKAQLRRMLEGEGFTLGDWDTARVRDAAARAKGRRGRLGVKADVGELWVWRDGTAVHPSPGQVGMSVTLDTYLAY